MRIPQSSPAGIQVNESLDLPIPRSPPEVPALIGEVWPFVIGAFVVTAACTSSRSVPRSSNEPCGDRDWHPPCRQWRLLAETATGDARSWVSVRGPETEPADALKLGIRQPWPLAAVACQKRTVDWDRHPDCAQADIQPSRHQCRWQLQRRSIDAM